MTGLCWDSLGPLPPTAQWRQLTLRVLCRIRRELTSGNTASLSWSVSLRHPLCLSPGSASPGNHLPVKPRSPQGRLWRCQAPSLTPPCQQIFCSHPHLEGSNMLHPHLQEGSGRLSELACSPARRGGTGRAASVRLARAFALRSPSRATPVVPSDTKTVCSPKWSVF